MGGWSMKKIYIGILCSVTFLLVMVGVHLNQVWADTSVYELYRLADNGNKELMGAYTSYQEANATMQYQEQSNPSNNGYMIVKEGKIKNITYGLVNFKTKATPKINTNYTIEYNGRTGYVNGYYGADGAFLGTNEDGTKIRFKQAGVIGWVNADEVELIDIVSDYNVVYTNSYTAYKSASNPAELKHNIATDIHSSSMSILTLGHEIPYGMTISVDKNRTYYLSYDGNYFYEESIAGYKKMIQDYKAGTHANAINKDQPYYNYYQYLSHRTVTNYTPENIKQYFSNYTKKPSSFPALEGESMLYGEEANFIQYQNEFGANAIMMLAVAVNESGYGQSSIAINTNNLFGHSAFDSSPGASANRYYSVAQSIWAHAKIYISEGLLDPCDGVSVNGNGASDRCHMGRYFGANTGNKASGMNVKYASDPYWGEKAAQYYYFFDKNFGFQDYGKYTIGIKENNVNYPIKQSPNNASSTLYTTGNSNNYPVLILGTVSGENINGNNTWYKIQTDPTLNAAKTGIVQDQGEYNFNHNIGYIHSSALSYVRNGKPIKPMYTIRFNPNGGKFEDNIATTKELSVEEYTIPVIGNPTKEGYRFVGWDQEIMGATENITYTARYESLTEKPVTTYSIAFLSSGGTFSDGTIMKKITVKEGEVPTMESPTKEGYTFIGWSPTLSPATKNTTYQAKYESNIKKYTITFDAAGGSFSTGTTIKKVTVKEGEVPTMESPTKDGYTFTGWSPTITGAKTDTTYQATYQKQTDNNPSKVDGFLYIDHIGTKNGKVEMKGFHTIETIDNNLLTSIQYKIVMMDIDTKKSIELKANRIIVPKEIPFQAYGFGGKDYTYSWFSFETDFQDVPSGNYIMKIVSSTGMIYSESIISNKLFVPQITSYDGSKHVIIRNNYYDNEQPIEWIVRENKLGSKTTSTYTYNQFDQFLELGFTTNNQLHIKGYTYSYGMDLGANQIVTRNIIIENKETYQTKVYKANAIKDAYDPVLPVSDHLAKTKAWYNVNLDITSLGVGVYRIYLTTKANISDISELTDLFNQDVSNIRKVINGKTYQIRTVSERGNIIELVVT